MSPLLITSSIIFLVLFCAVVYVVENWIFWKSTGSGPRRWGWIQSWAPNGRPIVIKGDPKTTPNPKWTVEDWKKWDKGIRIAREASERQVQARQLYTDGWRCGRFTETGNQTLYRGESEAYVSIEVWNEVERLTKAKWDELHGKPIPKYPIGTDSSPEGPAVVGEKGKETITVNGSTLYVPGGILDWSKIPPASSSNVDWKQFGVKPTGKPMFWDGSTLKEVPPKEYDLPGIGKIHSPRIEFQPRERTQVTEVPEMPMERVVSPSGKVYNWPDVRHPDFKKSFMLPDDRPTNADLMDMIRMIDRSNRMSELKRHRFLPSVNPLGDTGAFRRTIYYDPIFPPMWLKYADRVSFRHKKGGKRG